MTFNLPQAIFASSNRVEIAKWPGTLKSLRASFKKNDSENNSNQNIPSTITKIDLVIDRNLVSSPEDEQEAFQMLLDILQFGSNQYEIREISLTGDGSTNTTWSSYIQRGMRLGLQIVAVRKQQQQQQQQPNNYNENFDSFFDLLRRSSVSMMASSNKSSSSLHHEIDLIRVEDASSLELLNVLIKHVCADDGVPTVPDIRRLEIINGNNNNNSSTSFEKHFIDFLQVTSATANAKHVPFFYISPCLQSLSFENLSGFLTAGQVEKISQNFLSATTTTLQSLKMQDCFSFEEISVSKSNNNNNNINKNVVSPLRVLCETALERGNVSLTSLDIRSSSSKSVSATTRLEIIKSCLIHPQITSLILSDNEPELTFNISKPLRAALRKSLTSSLAVSPSRAVSFWDLDSSTNNSPKSPKTSRKSAETTLSILFSNLERTFEDRFSKLVKKYSSSSSANIGKSSINNDDSSFTTIINLRGYAFRWSDALSIIKYLQKSSETYFTKLETFASQNPDKVFGSSKANQTDKQLKQTFVTKAIQNNIVGKCQLSFSKLSNASSEKSDFQFLKDLIAVLVPLDVDNQQSFSFAKSCLHVLRIDDLLRRCVQRLQHDQKNHIKNAFSSNSWPLLPYLDEQVWKIVRFCENLHEFDFYPTPSISSSHYSASENARSAADVIMDAASNSKNEDNGENRSPNFLSVSEKDNLSLDPRHIVTSSTLIHLAADEPLDVNLIKTLEDYSPPPKSYKHNNNENDEPEEESPKEEDEELIDLLSQKNGVLPRHLDPSSRSIHLQKLQHKIKALLYSKTESGTNLYFTFLDLVLSSSTSDNNANTNTNTSKAKRDLISSVVFENNTSKQQFVSDRLLLGFRHLVLGCDLFQFVESVRFVFADAPIESSSSSSQTTSPEENNNNNQHQHQLSRKGIQHLFRSLKGCPNLTFLDAGETSKFQQQRKQQENKNLSLVSYWETELVNQSVALLEASSSPLDSSPHRRKNMTATSRLTLISDGAEVLHDIDNEDDAAKLKMDKELEAMAGKLKGGELAKYGTPIFKALLPLAECDRDKIFELLQQLEQENQLQHYQQMQNVALVTSGDTPQQRRATIQNLKNQTFGQQQQQQTQTDYSDLLFLLPSATNQSQRPSSAIVDTPSNRFAPPFHLHGILRYQELEELLLRRWTLRATARWRTFALPHCAIGNRGAELVFKFLEEGGKSCPTLRIRQVDLKNNDIVFDLELVKKLISAIQSLGLTHVDLRENTFFTNDTKSSCLNFLHEEIVVNRKTPTLQSLVLPSLSISSSSELQHQNILREIKRVLFLNQNAALRNRVANLLSGDSITLEIPQDCGGDAMFEAVCEDLFETSNRSQKTTFFETLEVISVRGCLLTDKSLSNLVKLGTKMLVTAASDQENFKTVHFDWSLNRFSANALLQSVTSVLRKFSEERQKNEKIRLGKFNISLASTCHQKGSDILHVGSIDESFVSALVAAAELLRSSSSSSSSFKLIADGWPSYLTSSSDETKKRFSRICFDSEEEEALENTASNNEAVAVSIRDAVCTIRSRINAPSHLAQVASAIEDFASADSSMNDEKDLDDKEVSYNLYGAVTLGDGVQIKKKRKTKKNEISKIVFAAGCSKECASENVSAFLQQWRSLFVTIVKYCPKLVYFGAPDCEWTGLIFRSFLADLVASPSSTLTHVDLSHNKELFSASPSSTQDTFSYLAQVLAADNTSIRFVNLDGCFSKNRSNSSNEATNYLEMINRILSWNAFNSKKIKRDFIWIEQDLIFNVCFQIAKNSTANELDHEFATDDQHDQQQDYFPLATTATWFKTMFPKLPSLPIISIPLNANTSNSMKVTGISPSSSPTPSQQQQQQQQQHQGKVKTTSCSSLYSLMWANGEANDAIITSLCDSLKQVFNFHQTRLEANPAWSANVNLMNPFVPCSVLHYHKLLPHQQQSVESLDVISSNSKTLPTPPATSPAAGRRARGAMMFADEATAGSKTPEHQTQTSATTATVASTIQQIDTKNFFPFSLLDLSANPGISQQAVHQLYDLIQEFSGIILKTGNNNKDKSGANSPQTACLSGHPVQQRQRSFSHQPTGQTHQINLENDDSADQQQRGVAKAMFAHAESLDTTTHTQPLREFNSAPALGSSFNNPNNATLPTPPANARPPDSTPSPNSRRTFAALAPETNNFLLLQNNHQNPNQRPNSASFLSSSRIGFSPGSGSNSNANSPRAVLMGSEKIFPLFKHISFDSSPNILASPQEDQVKRVFDEIIRLMSGHTKMTISVKKCVSSLNNNPSLFCQKIEYLALCNAQPSTLRSLLLIEEDYVTNTTSSNSSSSNATSQRQPRLALPSSMIYFPVTSLSAPSSSAKTNRKQNQKRTSRSKSINSAYMQTNSNASSSITASPFASYRPKPAGKVSSSTIPPNLVGGVGISCSSPIANVSTTASTAATSDIPLNDDSCSLLKQVFTRVVASTTTITSSTTTHILHLKLPRNQITATGCINLIEGLCALPKNQLITLDLSENQIGDTACFPIINKLLLTHCKNSIKTVNLTQNYFGESSINVFVSGLEQLRDEKKDALIKAGINIPLEIFDIYGSTGISDDQSLAVSVAAKLVSYTSPDTLDFGDLCASTFEGLSDFSTAAASFNVLAKSRTESLLPFYLVSGVLSQSFHGMKCLDFSSLTRLKDGDLGWVTKRIEVDEDGNEIEPENNASKATSSHAHSITTFVAFDGLGADGESGNESSPYCKGYSFGQSGDDDESNNTIELPPPCLSFVPINSLTCATCFSSLLNRVLTLSPQLTKLDLSNCKSLSLLAVARIYTECAPFINEARLLNVGTMTDGVKATNSLMPDEIQFLIAVCHTTYVFGNSNNMKTFIGPFSENVCRSSLEDFDRKTNTKKKGKEFEKFVSLLLKGHLVVL